MSIFERRLLTGSFIKPFVWLRYIDDIFAIWSYGEDEFKDHMPYINSIHSTFQFTCNYSKECVQFLDVSVSVENSGNISTDLHVKPTDTHQYLLATSCHSNHTKRSMPMTHHRHHLRHIKEVIHKSTVPPHLHQIKSRLTSKHKRRIDSRNCHTQ